MCNIESIVDYGSLCGEGPVWDAEAHILYWTDLTGKEFYKFEPASRACSIVSQGFQVCGCRLNRAGGFVVVNGEGFWLWDGAQAKRRIRGELDGLPLAINDCSADPAGRLLGGTNYYDASGGYRRGQLLRMDHDGRITVLDEGFDLSNGIGFSPDGRILYFTDSVARIIFCYDYDPSTGEAGNRRVFVKVPQTEGLPDGLAVDAEGFVWSAQWFGSCVVRYDPDGRIERRITTPAKQTSAVVFGGEDLTDIYITSAAQSEPMPVMPLGYDPASGYFGGALYRVNLGIRGRVQELADIRL